jgi:FMN phosphatase YigB (HAD superfamily)|tara:strand:- start:557 stop:1129 length:573 start_codon:yes stop_codon:yes gene_type:complete
MKKIITDVDGVLLDWNTKFNEWMEDEGFAIQSPDNYAVNLRYDINREQAEGLIKDFNESTWISHLSYLRDAKEGVQKLVDNGYKIDICTAVGTNEYTQETRNRHLRYSFGKKTFDKMHYVTGNGPKDHILEQYDGTGLYWLEDKPENAVTGLKFGLKPILISHPWNTWFHHPDVEIADNWEKVCEIILNE